MHAYVPNTHGTHTSLTMSDVCVRDASRTQDSDMVYSLDLLTIFIYCVRDVRDASRTGHAHTFILCEYGHNFHIYSQLLHIYSCVSDAQMTNP